MKAPAFQFYPNDFIGETAAFSPHEAGCFIRLLCHQWNNGSIPVEPARLKCIAGGDVSEYVIAKFQKTSAGNLINDRLEQTRKKQNDYHEEQRKKGIASGKAREKLRQHRLNHGSTDVETTVQPDRQPETNSSSSSSISPTKLKKRRELSDSEKRLASLMESLLGIEWQNDAGKWINRIKNEFSKAERVIGDLKSVIEIGRTKIKTRAGYAQDLWDRFI